ncbi:MAG: DUF1553 domain-containing protein, partial [Planctomycetales bacterium]
LQALATLNDPTFVEAARHLAQRTLLEGGTTQDSRLDFLTRRILSRPLHSAERSVAVQALHDLTAFYQDRPQEAAALIAVGDSRADSSLDPKLLAAWTMLANELFNLDEALNK